MMSAGAARRILLPFYPALSKRIREGCDRGSEVRTVYSAQDGKRPVPLRKLNDSGRTGSCEKNFVSKKIAGISNLCNDRGQWAGNMSKDESWSSFGERVNQFITGKSRVTGDPLEA